MVNAIRLGVLATLVVSSTLPLSAQPAQPAQPTAQAATNGAPPPILVIYREEVRPGKTGAHATSEAAWAHALRKGGSPVHWLAMTTVAGPNEAWFLSGHANYAAYEATETAAEANTALDAENEKFATSDGELLTRSSTIMARYRPALSYQPEVSMPSMRYVTVDIVRVKPGHESDFFSTWQQVIAAHKEAGMKEHWAVYEVEAGMPDTTYLFMYARKTLGEIDQAGPMHAAAAYRDAVGEVGRTRMREATQAAVQMSQTLVFRMRPNMSLMSDEWTKADPEFWTPKPPAPAMAQKKKQN